VRHACKVAQHHAEAVIQRHRDAQAIVLREAHGHAAEVAVVEDVVVSEGRALRRTGRARGELDVDRIVALQLLAERLQLVELVATRRLQQLREIDHARRDVIAEADDQFERGHLPGAQLAGRTVRDLGQQLGQDREVVARFERWRHDERPTLHQVECVLQFGAPVRRIDVDQDQSRLGRCELRQQPLGVVLRPDADAIAGHESKAQQACGERVHGVLQLAPRPASILMAHDQRLAICKALDGPVEAAADRFADQRQGAAAVNIAESHAGEVGFPRPVPTDIYI
jgi:hypothetical protein